ncbi:MAG: hypothetical protein ABSG15_09595 [FCB group bacterium]|jgi:hypothetical protein
MFKNLSSTLSVLLILFSNLYSQSPAFYENYKIPAFTTTYFKIGALNNTFYNYIPYNNPPTFINYQDDDTKTSFGLNLDTYFDYYKQDQKSNFEIQLSPYISTSTYTYKDTSQKQNDGTYYDISSAFSLNYTRYFGNDYKGFHLYSSLANNTHFSRDHSLSDKYFTNSSNYDIPVEIGFGLGRITNVYPVALAIAVLQVTNSPLNDSLVNIVSEIIDKYNSGYYSAKFKDNADLQFYQDIATTLNKPDDILKIQQIFTYRYIISTRSIGYLGEIIGGYDFFNDANKNLSSIGIKGAYSLPIGYDWQLNASLIINKYFPKLYYNYNYLFNTNGSISLNYNINYRFSISLNASVAYSNRVDDSNGSMDEYSNYTSISANYFLMNMFSITGSFSYQTNRAIFKEDSYNQNQYNKTTNFNIGFYYYIF